jgi:hypothetical protein
MKIMPVNFFVNVFTYLLVEEIRNMINNKNMPLFVQDIWPILVNFLLRAKHESLVISKIFEDIAFCLFDKDIFESSLVCFIVSIISGSKSMNEIILDKVDFLLSWFLRNSICDTLNFSSIHIINIIMNKINILEKDVILWRCQFIRLFYGQFLSDFGCIGSLNYSIPTDLLGSNDSFEQSGFIKLFKEECSILEARNFIKFRSTDNNSPSKCIDPCSYSSVPDASFHISTFNPIKSSPVNQLRENMDISAKQDHFNNISRESSLFSPITENNVISDAITHSPSLIEDSNIADSGSIVSSDSPKISSKPEMNANVFGKLKSWFPAGKNTNQENQKQLTKANLGKPSSFRYDDKLKKWVDDNDPSTLEEAPKLPPPPTMASINSSPVSSDISPSNAGPINFRAKKGKVKYFDPLNPDGPSSSQLQPSVPNFD